MDLVVADATVVDGTGAPGMRGWLGVERDRIAVVGRGNERAPAAERTIDARGMVVAPGFVDVHNHSDLSPFVLPTMPSTVRQGVTSVVVGNCGSSPFPLSSWDEGLSLAYAPPGGAHPRPSWAAWGDYLNAIDAARPAVNVATLVGHGSVRREILGDQRRPPTHEELGRMRAPLRGAGGGRAGGPAARPVFFPGGHFHNPRGITPPPGGAGARGAGRPP